MVIFISNCGLNNNPQISQMPELINPETGLRELRFRRYDCLHLRETTNTEDCETSETITQTTPNEPNVSPTVLIDEQTPWMTEKSRTVVNPTLQRNSILNNIIVKAYLRSTDPNTNQNNDKLYIFEGDLKEFERNKANTLYIKLNQKTAASADRVNASLYCVDEKNCLEGILTFAFTNYNISGQAFIDSRHFHIDEREPELKDSDFIPGQASQSITEVQTDPILPEARPIDDLIEGHRDDGFVDRPQGPVLPRSNIAALCRGLIGPDAVCPPYIVDSNLPKPSINDEELKEEVLKPVDEDTEQSLFPLERFILNNENYVNLSEADLNRIRNNFLNPTQMRPPIINQLDIQRPELSQPDSPKEEESSLAPKASIRPKARPEGLGARNEVNFESSDMSVPLISIDDKFTYNLALCEDHLQKSKSVKYNQARGFYSNGRLTNASHYTSTMHVTNSLTKSRKDKQYSSAMTKEIIEFAGCVLKQRYGDSLLTNINDLSSKNGGRLGGHASHQNGLDADTSYPHVDGKTRNFDNFTSDMNNKRVVAAIDMARIMIYTDRVKTLFTDNRIRKRFCKYIKDQNKLDEFRPLIESYMYHVKGHHNHYHIRVKCNSQNEGCTVQGRLGPDNICSSI